MVVVEGRREPRPEAVQVRLADLDLLASVRVQQAVLNMSLIRLVSDLCEIYMTRFRPVNLIYIGIRAASLVFFLFEDEENQWKQIWSHQFTGQSLA